MEYKLFTSTVSQFESTNSLKEEEIKLLQRKFGLDEDGKI
jgi:Ca2+-binding EF-hand superfamily protein